MVVEVRSPATSRIDEVRKRSLYEQAGVSHYWLADPATPSITVLDLADGHYRQTALADETLVLEAPFPIKVNVPQLLRD